MCRSPDWPCWVGGCPGTRPAPGTPFGTALCFVGLAGTGRLPGYCCSAALGLPGVRAVCSPAGAAGTRRQHQLVTSRGWESKSECVCDFTGLLQAEGQFCWTYSTRSRWSCPSVTYPLNRIVWGAQSFALVPLLHVMLLLFSHSMFTWRWYCAPFHDHISHSVFTCQWYPALLHHHELTGELQVSLGDSMSSCQD